MENIKICFNPGHGGNDRVNRGPTGYVEADGVLKMAKYTKSYINMATSDINIIMTRDIDKTVSISQASKIAIDNKVAMMFSFHTNAGGGRGPECYYSVDIPSDKDFAEELCKKIAKEFNTVNRGAKIKTNTNNPGEDYFGIIDKCQDAGIPHVFLFEPLFHDNEIEEKILKSEDGLRKIGFIIAQHIVEFLGFVFNVDYRALDAPLKPKPFEPNTIHTVVRGETLYGICEKYGVKIGNVIIDNNLKNQNMIYPDQRLLIRNPKKNVSITHTVVRGDMLSKICIKYGADIEEVIKDNNIKNPNYLYIGQNIVINNPKRK